MTKGDEMNSEDIEHKKMVELEVEIIKLHSEIKELEDEINSKIKSFNLMTRFYDESEYSEKIL